MKTSRVLRPLVAAAALAILSGCALLPEAPIQPTLAPTVAPTSTRPAADTLPGAIRRQLEATLEKIPGVENAELEEWQGDKVDIAVLVTDWNEADLVSIATTVTTLSQMSPEAGISELRVASLFGQPAELRVSLPSAISTKDFEREFDYWAALTVAYQAPLGLWLHTERPSVDYSAQMTGFLLPTARQLTEMRALPDDTASPKEFLFDGSQFVSLEEIASMPVESMNALESAIQALVPASALSPGSVIYSSIRQSVDVSVSFAEFNRANPKLSEDWPVIQQIAQLILDQGYDHSTLRVVSSQAAVVHFGWCVNITSTDYAGADDALWAALKSLGLSMPEGSGAGTCLDW